MIPREMIISRENAVLSEKACRSESTIGRDVFEPSCDFRTEFQRDRDRITHSNAFRRLKHKTQVFLNPVSEHYRTRLTHTLEVSQIARTISRALSLNEDLTEAIALGHDLGHTPFGHDGERVLDKLYKKGFQHNVQSVRVVEVIERDGLGLNLTAEVRDGILNHRGLAKAKTLEGQVVRFADKIAYINHDIEDAVRAGILTNDELPKEPIAILGNSKSARITTLIRSIFENSDAEISYSAEVAAAHDELRSFMFKNVYGLELVNTEKRKSEHIIEFLYNHYLEKPYELPDFFLNLYNKTNPERAVCDFISGMTDDYAVETFKELCLPKFWKK